jgi:mono/diheme cytochrome c family protein
MKNKIYFYILCAASAFLVLLQLNCSPNTKKQMTKEQLIAKGKYLVNLGGCNDCHSPKIMTAMGPVPDTTRLLSGNPANEPMPVINKMMMAQHNWVLTNMSSTAWVGQWGASFTANLTPDKETGIGTWTPEIFIKALRTGKHMGIGRPIMPPMPWQSIGKLKDEDLKAIFAYLQSLPPILNKAPAPVPPNMITKYFKKK